MSVQPKDKDSSGQGGRIRRQPERNNAPTAEQMRNLLQWMQVVAERDETHRQLKDEENKKRYK